MDAALMSPTRLTLQEETFQLALAEHGVGGYGLNVNARYVEASWARVCALLGDEIGNQTAAGWQTTIDLYDDAGLLEGRVTPADVLPRQ